MKIGLRELMFLVLMMGLLACSYLFVFKPAHEKRLTRQADTAAKKKQLADLKQSTAGIDDLERKITELEEAIKFFESKLPQEKEVDKILSEVTRMAEANNLQTRTIKTLKPERSAGYSELPIQISLQGEFKPGFYQFLQQLEKLSRITKIGQMKLDKIQTQDGYMQAQMTLSIFFESEGGSRTVASTN